MTPFKRQFMIFYDQLVEFYRLYIEISLNVNFIPLMTYKLQNINQKNLSWVILPPCE